MQGEPLRVDLVGGGFIGGVVGAQFAANPDATVAAIADPSVSAPEELAEQFDLAAGSLYLAHETMFANEALDAALIGTPHTFHYEQIVAALEHDLHVLCDKPLTPDLDRARDLNERAERSDRTLMVGYQRHLYPAFIAGRERWREHEPDFLTAEVTQSWIVATQGTWRLDPTLSGGGFLYGTGSHLLDVVLWMTDLEPASIAADMTIYDEERIDERARLSLDFANGATAAISTHGDARSHQKHTHVRDDAGAVYFESHQWGTPAVTRIDESGETTHPSFENEERRTKADASVEAVGTGTEPPATVRHALAVTAVTEAADESARTGERVAVDVE